MITRSTKLQLIAFALVALVGLSFAGGRYANLGHLLPWYDPGTLVSADFSDSGGVFVGAEVTYRGVPVGKVASLTLEPDGVRVGLRLRPGTKVPTPTKAVVANRSAIGEQYVDLQPQSDGPHYLAGGDVIPRSMTAIPIQPTQLVVNLDRLVRSVNLTDLSTVLDELGQAVNGADQSLQRLIDASDQLTTTATQNLPQTLALIQASKPVLATQVQVGSALRSYSTNLAQLTAQLRASDPDFRTLFRTGADAAATATSLLDETRATLPALIGNLAFVAQVQAVRIPALRQILVTYPNVVAGGFTVTPGDGTAHFGFATTQSPPPCAGGPGYPNSVRRDPSDTSPRTSNFNAYCSQRTGPSDIRGADHAPRAEGLSPFPYDGPGGSSGTVRGAGMSPTTGWSTMFADYDPTSGHAITANGQRYTLASSQGLDAMFGPDSWQWLLMDPLRHS